MVCKTRRGEFHIDYNRNLIIKENRIRMLDKTWEEASRLMEILSGLDPASEKYHETIRNLSELISIQDRLYERNHRSRMSEILTNPIVISGLFQLMATVLIINHESVGVITTRAFSWIRFK